VDGGVLAQQVGAGAQVAQGEGPGALLRLLVQLGPGLAVGSDAVAVGAL
jgi:hypothetical protein